MDTQQTNKKSSSQAFNAYRVKNLEKFREYSKNFYHEKQKNDPEFMEKKKQAALARYYDAKRGNILRITRPSINNSVEIALRRVIEPKPFFK